MSKSRTHRRAFAVASGLLSVAMVAAVLSLTGTVVAGATEVGDETAFRAAFTGAAETSIVLTADVTLTCGGGGAVARTSATPVTIDGQGQYTITQTCADTEMLVAVGGGGVGLRGVTLTGGSIGVESDGPIDVRDSRIANLSHTTDSAIAVASSSTAPVTIVDSVIEDVTGPTVLGVIAPSASVTASGLQVRRLSATTMVLGAVAETLTLTGSSLTDLTSDGAVIGVEGEALRMTRTTVRSLSATTNGIGVFGVSADTVVTDSFVGDLAGTDVFGILAQNGASVYRSSIVGLTGTEEAFGFLAGSGSGLVLVDSTIADVTGPAVYSADDVTVVYSTIRHTGGPLVAPEATSVPVTAAENAPQIWATDALVMFGTVVVDPHAGSANCDATSNSSAGYNFADDTTCALTATGDRQGAGLVAGLGALGDHGGLGPTFVPEDGSPLIDAIPVAKCQYGPGLGVTTDERGEPRPALGGCDIGAVEVQPPPEPTFTG